MNKTFKRIAAATLAAATLATTMISASAYTVTNLQPIKYVGSSAYTAAQREMYPEFTEEGMKSGKGIYVGLVSSGHIAISHQSRLNANDIAAVFNYNDDTCYWVSSVTNYHSGYRPITFGKDNMLWPQSFQFLSVSRGTAPVLQYVKSAEYDAKRIGYKPLVARVMEVDPVITDIDVLNTRHSYYGTTSDIQLELDAAYMSTNVTVYVWGVKYNALLTDIVPADEYTGSLGKAIYTIKDVPTNGVRITGITIQTPVSGVTNPKVTLDGKNDSNIYGSYWQLRNRPNDTDPNFVPGVFR